MPCDSKQKRRTLVSNCLDGASHKRGIPQIRESVRGESNQLWEIFEYIPNEQAWGGGGGGEDKSSLRGQEESKRKRGALRKPVYMTAGRL